MKNYIRLLLLAAVVILSVTALIAQTKDIVYLKNGSVIKGTILEMIPEKTIKIQTSDGNIFVYNMSEVEKVGKEAVAPSIEQKQAVERPSSDVRQRSYDSQRSYEGQRSDDGLGAKFSIFGGIALPVGNFAMNEGPFEKEDSANVGMAKLGWSVGAQLITGGAVGLLLEGSYSQNKLNPPTSYTQQPGTYEWTPWISILALAGIKIGTDNASGSNFFIAPLAGALFLKTPEIRFTPTGSKTTQTVSSHSATGFAYGVNIEFIFGEHVTLSGKYIASKPIIKWTDSFLIRNYDFTFEQNVTIVQVCLGVAF
jgi:hypothetical protein